MEAKEGTELEGGNDRQGCKEPAEVAILEKIRVPHKILLAQAL
jgi:hypothetical protein